MWGWEKNPRLPDYAFLRFQLFHPERGSGSNFLPPSFSSLLDLFWQFIAIGKTVQEGGDVRRITFNKRIGAGLVTTNKLTVKTMNERVNQDKLLTGRLCPRKGAEELTAEALHTTCIQELTFECASVLLPPTLPVTVRAPERFVFAHMTHSMNRGFTVRTYDITTHCVLHLKNAFASDIKSEADFIDELLIKNAGAAGVI